MINPITDEQLAELKRDRAAAARYFTITCDEFDGMIARIQAAETEGDPVKQERADFVAMKRPPEIGAAALGRRFERH